MSENLKRETVSNCIEVRSRAYAKHNITNILPGIDGFQAVQKRTLWMLNLEPPGLMDMSHGAIKTKQIHPYNEKTISDTIARLGQRFNYLLPFVYVKGKNSSYNGDQQAAARYTKCMLTEFTRDVLFRGIDLAAIPTTLSETLESYEPKYLIPKLPFALLVANVSIGFGTKNCQIPYDFGKVCDLVYDMSKFKKEYGVDIPFRPKHFNYFVPQFPTKCTVRNLSALMDRYKQNSFTNRIVTEGIFDITYDKINLKLMGHGVSFNTIKPKITEKCVNNKQSWLYKHITSLKDIADSKTNDETCNLEFKIKSTCNPFEAIKYLKSEVNYTKSITPKADYHIGGVLINPNPITLADMWYSARYKTIVSSKKFKQAEITKQLHELEASFIVVDHIDDVVSIIKNNKKEVSIDLLIEKYNLTWKQSIVLHNLPLHTLSNTSKDELLQKQNALKTDLETLIASYDSVHDEIGETAMKLKKKYVPQIGEIVSKLPDYIGYVRVKNFEGIIQISDRKEIVSIAKAFPRSELEVVMYPSKAKFTFVECDPNPDKYDLLSPQVAYTNPTLEERKAFANRFENILSKHSMKKEIFLTFVKPKFKVSLSKGVGWYSTVLNLPTIKGHRSLLVGNHFKVITNKGKIIEDGKQVLKLANHGRKLTHKSNVVFAFDPIDEYDIVFYMNSACKNVLRYRLIGKDTSKLQAFVDSDLHVVGVYNTRLHKELYLPLINECLNRTTVKYVHINDWTKFNDVNGEININSSKSGKFKLKRNKVISNIVELH